MTENSHRYLKEIEMREESGTPAIVGDIRAGLVFQLKQVKYRIQEMCKFSVNHGGRGAEGAGLDIC